MTINNLIQSECEQNLKDCLTSRKSSKSISSSLHLKSIGSRNPVSRNQKDWRTFKQSSKNTRFSLQSNGAANQSIDNDTTEYEMPVFKDMMSERNKNVSLALRGKHPITTYLNGVPNSLSKKSLDNQTVESFLKSKNFKEEVQEKLKQLSINPLIFFIHKNRHLLELISKDIKKLRKLPNIGAEAENNRYKDINNDDYNELVEFYTKELEKPKNFMEVIEHLKKKQTLIIKHGLKNSKGTTLLKKIKSTISKNTEIQVPNQDINNSSPTLDNYIPKSGLETNAETKSISKQGSSKSKFWNKTSPIKLNGLQRRSLNFNESSAEGSTNKSRSVSKSYNDQRELEQSNKSQKFDERKNSQTSKRKILLNSIISSCMEESKNLNIEKKSFSACLKDIQAKSLVTQDVIKTFHRANEQTPNNLLQFYEYSREEEKSQRDEASAVVNEYKQQCSPNSYANKVDKISRRMIRTICLKTKVKANK